MTRGCLLLLLLVMACTKADKDAPKETGSALAAAPVEEKKTSGKSAAEVMQASIEEAKAKAAAQTPPPTPPTPTTPTPPADPMPPETPPPAPPADPVAAEPADGAAPAVMEFKIGDRVMAKWDNAKWYPGKIVGIKNGKYDVDYDDGDKSRGLSPTRVRKPGASTPSTSSGGGAKASGDAPCPGPGLTRRCNGKCVNIQEDSNHCGGCNNRCPSGKRCDGHMFCRDADGNL
jgi:hypothetical protein